MAEAERSNEALHAKSEEFAQSIATTLDLVLPGDTSITSRPLESGGGTTVSTPHMINLYRGGTECWRMHIRYRCTWSSSSTYLAINDSRLAVHRVNGGVPLIGFDYLRHPNGAPASHINVSGIHEDITSHLPDHGKAGHPHEQALKSSKIHLPNGGHRFRPALEDVLEMLITDFHVDHHKKTAMEAIRQGRLDYRQRQLWAAVTDDPNTAHQALKSVNDDYTMRTDRMEAY